MTQKQLAEQLNVTDKTVSKWETGYRLPDAAILLELSSVLKVDINELLAGEEFLPKELSPEEYEKKAERSIVGLVSELNEIDKRSKSKSIGTIAGISLIGLALLLLFTSSLREGRFFDIIDMPTLIYLLGLKFSVLSISGWFHDYLNVWKACLLGKVIRMVTNNLDQFVQAGNLYGDYMLVLSNGTDKWEYAKELAEKYNGQFSFIASKSNGENISGALKPAVWTILMFLLLVTILTTVNLTFILIRREQRLIGLLKALGMTSWQILRIYSWRNCLSALVGTDLGIVLGIFVIPCLLTPYARLLGITEFPFINSLTGMVISFALLPLCMLLSTSAVIKVISTVSVKQLVSE